MVVVMVVMLMVMMMVRMMMMMMVKMVVMMVMEVQSFYQMHFLFRTGRGNRCWCNDHDDFVGIRIRKCIFYGHTNT